ncbi:hypothetical protein CORC01_11296 [Colletotrichum orchidophilum]|uniref:Uncharacterized protein n=1 Tax=Colletotrichum orchidophilum TaxID=1209926 RepID=A0A1G4AWD0_9PEZI|nr:uncharacterized protein CORC01_11296 [Colletotrichum orchidophilum]OHE93431.1 hypothetical protein CORC01_11296 [Colletotrichum orchidophilum]
MRLSHIALRAALNLAYGVLSVSAEAKSVRKVADNRVVVDNNLGAEKALAATSPRHDQEKKSLMKRMSKSHGKWDITHPRHRLLNTLVGFERYKARQMAELNRWKGLYKHVSKTQRAVSGHHAVPETSPLGQNARWSLILHQELTDHAKAKDDAGQPAHRVSTSQALRHFVRDWSSTGRGERDDAFPCILDTLATLFPDRSEKEDVTVLLS